MMSVEIKYSSALSKPVECDSWNASYRPLHLQEVIYGTNIRLVSSTALELSL